MNFAVLLLTIFLLVAKPESLDHNDATDSPYIYGSTRLSKQS